MPLEPLFGVDARLFLFGFLCSSLLGYLLASTLEASRYFSLHFVTNAAS